MVTKTVLQTLSGETIKPAPIWLMRQAGRYLPEYRATREQAGGFLDLCYTPELATEVTLQPIRRYGFDAAILFADILLVPQALGQKLWFVQGEGPRLEPISDTGSLNEAADVHETLSPIYETVSRLRSSLPETTTLIGFAGSPWTVATYMIAGRGTPDQAPALALMKDSPAAFDRIVDRIADATIEYLSHQIEAGAEVVKLFDSWASVLVGDDFKRACLDPTLKIVETLRSRHPDTPIIGFPRGVGELAVDYVQHTKVDCIAIGQDVDIVWARDHLQGLATVQGNLDPKHLLTGGDEMRVAIDHILAALSDGPFIFNLGHGITPDVPPAVVSELVDHIRASS